MMDEKKKKISDFFQDEYHKMVSFVKQRIDDAAHRDGEDIVQDVVLGILDKADMSVPFENLSAYIYQSLKNKIVDTFRTHKKTLSLDSSYETDDQLTLIDILHDPRYNIESNQEREDMKIDLYQAIDSLNQEEKAIIIMTEFEGMSFKNISEKEGIPIGTLLSKKSRALKKIRKSLDRNYLKE